MLFDFLLTVHIKYIFKHIFLYDNICVFFMRYQRNNTNKQEKKKKNVKVLFLNFSPLIFNQNEVEIHRDRYASTLPLKALFISINACSYTPSIQDDDDDDEITYGRNQKFNSRLRWEYINTFWRRSESWSSKCCVCKYEFKNLEYQLIKPNQFKNDQMILL